VDNIEEALAGGAIAATTSNRQLWENFKK